MDRLSSEDLQATAWIGDHELTLAWLVRLHSRCSLHCQKSFFLYWVMRKTGHPRRDTGYQCKWYTTNWRGLYVGAQREPGGRTNKGLSSCSVPLPRWEESMNTCCFLLLLLHRGTPLPSEQAAWRLSLVLLTISFSLWAAGAWNSSCQCTTATVAGKL